jgi:hypothetical protein
MDRRVVEEHMDEREYGDGGARAVSSKNRRLSADDSVDLLIQRQAERYRDENEALDQHPLWLESVGRHAEEHRQKAAKLEPGPWEPQGEGRS